MDKITPAHHQQPFQPFAATQLTIMVYSFLTQHRMPATPANSHAYVFMLVSLLSKLMCNGQGAPQFKAESGASVKDGKADTDTFLQQSSIRMH